jgi:hypothetical protein
MSKVNSIKIIISALILFVLLVYFSYLKEGKTQANLVSLEGWGWIGADCVDANESSCDLTTLPVGWISLNSNNPEITCKNITYGVNINPSTGEISGSAWIGVGEDDITTDCNKTENTVGWLDFDSNQTPTCGQNGYPSDYCFPAKLVGTEIQGWAPIISKDHQGNTTTVTWVRFKGNNYRVQVNSDNTVTGYAWSGWGKDGGLGWIYFLTTLPVSKALLIVQSLPITGISITANPSQFSGTTNYSVSSTNPISASLTAPMSFGSYEFERWQGCDSASNNECNVSVNTGEVQIVQAIYTTPPPSPPSSFDLSVTSLDIRTFICKNRDFDLRDYNSSFLKEYLSRNPYYRFAPSTTYATEFYNRVASSTCPESQRNRPVEFSATGECRTGTCPEWKLRIDIISNSPLGDRETTSSETTSNRNPTKSIQFIYTFDKPYDYTVRACVLDQNNRPITDTNPNNNCKEQTLRIFDYMCLLGFCTQAQRDINNPSTLLIDLQYKILQTFRDTDSPCRFWRNEICRAQFGF